MGIESLYARNTQTQPLAGGIIYDLDKTQGTPTTLTAGFGNDDTANIVFRFVYQISDPVIDGTTFPVSINCTSLSADSIFWWRVRRLNSAGVEQAVSANSNNFSVAGTATQTLTLSTTWQAGDYAEVEVWHQRLAGHASAEIIIGVNDANTFVDADFAPMIYLGSATLPSVANLTSGSYAETSAQASLFAQGLSVFNGARDVDGASMLQAFGDMLASSTSPPVSGWSQAVTVTPEKLPDIYLGAVQANASASMSSSGIAESFGTANIQSSAQLSALSYAETFASSLLDASSALSSTAIVVALSSAQIASTATATFTGLIDHPGQFSMSASATLVIEARAVSSGTTLMGSAASITISVWVQAFSSASMLSESTLSAAGIAESTSSSSLAARASLAANGIRIVDGLATISTDSTLVASGILDVFSVSSPASNASLSATGLAQVFLSAQVDSFASLSADGFVHITVPKVQNLRLVDIRPGAVDIEWDPLSFVDYYQVERQGSIIGTSLNTTYSDETVAAATQYAYRVRGVRVIA